MQRNESESRFPDLNQPVKDCPVVQEQNLSGK